MVVSIIALTLGMILPTVRAIFMAKTDRYAEGALTAMLGVTRGVAIETQNYALLHVQIGVDDECWASVFRYDPTTGKFVAGYFVCPKHPNVREKIPGNCPSCPANTPLIWNGLLPRLVQKGMAFGEVSARDPAKEPGQFRYVSGEAYQTALNDPNGWAGFTTFNVIFAPDGTLVTDVNGDPPDFDTECAAFADAPERIWDPGPGDPALLINETGVRIITVFDYKVAKLKTDRTAFFNEKDSSGEYLRGRFLVINPYTGQLIKTE